MSDLTLKYTAKKDNNSGLPNVHTPWKPDGCSADQEVPLFTVMFTTANVIWPRQCKNIDASKVVALYENVR